MTLDEQFQAIIDAAIEKATAIDCTAEEFRRGLLSWVHDINTQIEASDNMENPPDEDET
jgi:hypothetical protein